LAPFGEVFAFSPENYEEQKLGHIFGVIKIDDHSSDSSYVVNLLTSVIKKEYFSKPDRTAEESFEASLRKANLALAELARHGVVSWTGKVNFAAGSLERNNLHFSQLGNTHILLIRAGQIADIAEDLNAQKEAEPHPLRTFSNISSGKLEKNDKLIFTTDDLLEIFSPEEIRQNATYFDWQEFPSFIEASLKTNTSLAGTIVMDFREELPKIQKITKKVPMYEHLQPALKSDEEIRIQEEPIRESIPALNIAAPPSPQNESLYIVEGTEAPERTKYINVILSWLSSKTVKLASLSRKYLTRSLSALKNIKLPQKKFPSRLSGSAENIFAKIKLSRSDLGKRISANIPTEKKHLKYASIFAAALLIIILGIFSFQKISSKKSAPPAENSASETSTAPAPLNDISVKEISSLESVASLPQNANNVVLMNDTLYAITEPTSIVKIDPANGQTEETRSTLNSGNFSLLAAMPDLNTLFILTEDNKIISYTPINKNFQDNQISLPENFKAADMKTYLTYLYVLDASANQIYRFPRAEGGFSEAQKWLKSGQDLRGANRFAINDDIFTANDINIIPFLQGKTDTSIDFQKPQVPLRINAIFTAPGLSSIYVLDNANQRVVQYSKDGKISNQFWNDQISGFESLVADEKNSTVYLGKENELLKFSIN